MKNNLQDLYLTTGHSCGKQGHMSLCTLCFCEYTKRLPVQALYISEKIKNKQINVSKNGTNRC